MSAQNAEITLLTSGKCKREALTNLQLSFYVAQNAITRSERQAKLSDFTSRILKLALSLRNLGYSEAYLTNMVRALKNIASKIDFDNTISFSTFIAKGKWRQSYKASINIGDK